jgi:hypothetical protein
MNIQKNGPVHGTARRISSNSKMLKTEAKTSEIRHRAKIEQVKKELTANTPYVSTTEKASNEYGARESHSVKERQTQSRTVLNRVSGGVGRVRAEQRDKIGNEDGDNTVLEYSDSDSEGRVMGSARNVSERTASHLSDRLLTLENMCRREDDEYEDDFENYSSGEDPEPDMSPPPAYQLQSLHIDDERNLMQAQGKGKAFKPPSNGDIVASAIVRGALNGAEGYFRGDQSVPIELDIDRKDRGGPDKESFAIKQNRRGDMAKASCDALEVKSASTGRAEVRQRSVSAKGQPKGLSHPQLQSPPQHRQRGEESKGTLGGRAKPVNGTTENKTRTPSASTTNSAIADQRARLEQRAAERRERVLFLQKQAEERVLSKLRETEQQIKYSLLEDVLCIIFCFSDQLCRAACCAVSVVCILNKYHHPDRLKDAQEYESLEKLRCEKRYIENLIILVEND